MFHASCHGKELSVRDRGARTAHRFLAEHARTSSTVAWRDLQVSALDTSYGLRGNVYDRSGDTEVVGAANTSSPIKLAPVYTKIPHDCARFRENHAIADQTHNPEPLTCV